MHVRIWMDGWMDIHTYAYSYTYSYEILTYVLVLSYVCKSLGLQFTAKVIAFLSFSHDAVTSRSSHLANILSQHSRQSLKKSDSMISNSPL